MLALFERALEEVEAVMEAAVGRGVGGPELAGGLEARAASVDAAAWDAGLC